MAKPNFSEMFKNPKMVQLYKIGEDFTKPFAETLIKQVGLTAPKAGEPSLVVFDNACGTGVVSEALYKRGYGGRMELTCGDTSEPMVAYMGERIKEDGWQGATVKLIDAQDTKLPSSMFSHVFMNFALFGVPNPDSALKEMHRILKPNSAVAFTTWIKPGWYPETVLALSASPIPFPPLPPCSQLMKAISEGGEWDSPAFVRAKLESHNFSNIQISVLEAETKCTDLDAFIQMMDVMFKQFGRKIWTEEEQEKFGGKVGGAVRAWLVQKWGEGGEIVLNGDGLVCTAVKRGE